MIESSHICLYHFDEMFSIEIMLFFFVSLDPQMAVMVATRPYYLNYLSIVDGRPVDVILDCD